MPKIYFLSTVTCIFSCMSFMPKYARSYKVCVSGFGKQYNITTTNDSSQNIEQVWYISKHKGQIIIKLEVYDASNLDYIIQNCMS